MWITTVTGFKDAAKEKSKHPVCTKLWTLEKRSHWSLHSDEDHPAEIMAKITMEQRTQSEGEKNHTQRVVDKVVN